MAGPSDTSLNPPGPHDPYATVRTRCCVRLHLKLHLHSGLKCLHSGIRSNSCGQSKITLYLNIVYNSRLSDPVVPDHECMERGGHGLPKVSLAPGMTDSSTLCRRATAKTALWSYGVASGLWPMAVFYLFGHPTPYAYVLDTPVPTRA
jgi:hypothetical protein